MMMKFLTTAALLAGLAVTPAAAQTAGETPSADERLSTYREVADAVQRYAYYSVFDSVHVTLDGDTVTLTGKVTQPFKLRGIARNVEKVDGVLNVRNEIEVLPLSRYDDQLRLRLARAIYDNPHFRQYGAVDRPIHILVERGHVTLEGVVLGETDRALARALAKTAFGAFSVDVNLKTPAEAQSELERL